LSQTTQVGFSSVPTRGCSTNEGFCHDIPADAKVGFWPATSQAAIAAQTSATTLQAAIALARLGLAFVVAAPLVAGGTVSGELVPGEEGCTVMIAS